MSCYISTFRQTDKLLETLYAQLQNTETLFSLMYFSDHGLAHKNKQHKDVSLLHNHEFKQNYEVPLIVMSSNDKQRSYINAPKSGYYLMAGIAEWLGIKETSLAKQSTFFSDELNEASVKVFNGDSVVDVKK